MNMRSSAAGSIVVCLVLCVALAGCSGSEVSEPFAETSPSTRPVPGLETDRADVLGGLATAASRRAIETPTLLQVLNKTSDIVVLTSADGQNTATVNPGASLRLVSQRVCDWLPLTARSSDSRVIAEYKQPCHGQTWTITD